MMKNKDWKEVKLNEVGFVGRGKSRHRPRNAEFLYGGDYPFVQTGDIKASEFYLSTYSQTYSEDGLKQSKLWNEGTLCITIAANIAETAVLTIKACFPDSVIGFVPFKDKSDVRFIKYSFDILKLHFQSISQGTTQDNLSLEKLLSINFTLPSLPTQQKIADILGAYDELIENNRRRIVLLENMAAGLYKEWFVRMRPHGQILPTNAETGLPVGWEVKKFTDEISVLGGGTPKTENPEYWNGDICWFTPQDLDNNYFVLDTVRKITELGLKNCSSKLYPSGTVFITARGTVGKCVIAGVPMAMSQTNYALKSRGKLHQYIVFLITLSLVEKFKQEAIGAVFDTITTNNFSRTEIVIPDQKTLIQFEEIVISIFNQIKTLQEQTGVLRRVRDRLLPRLMSGALGG